MGDMAHLDIVAETRQLSLVLFKITRIAGCASKSQIVRAYADGQKELIRSNQDSDYVHWRVLQPRKA